MRKKDGYSDYEEFGRLNVLDLQVPTCRSNLSIYCHFWTLIYFLNHCLGPDSSASKTSNCDGTNFQFPFQISHLIDRLDYVFYKIINIINFNFEFIIRWRVMLLEEDIFCIWFVI